MKGEEERRGEGEGGEGGVEQHEKEGGCSRERWVKGEEERRDKGGQGGGASEGKRGERTEMEKGTTEDEGWRE